MMISREEAIKHLEFVRLTRTSELYDVMQDALAEREDALFTYAIEFLSQTERPKGLWVSVHEHMWRKYDGEIDTDAWECGYHNGPVCELCGKHICVNCNPDWAKDECDIESYRCSECNHHAKEKTGFCPNCGADCRESEE